MTGPSVAKQITPPFYNALGNWMALFQHPGKAPFPVEMARMGPDPIIVAEEKDQ